MEPGTEPCGITEDTARSKGEDEQTSTNKVLLIIKGLIQDSRCPRTPACYNFENNLLWVIFITDQWPLQNPNTQLPASVALPISGGVRLPLDFILPNIVNVQSKSDVFMKT